jgi:hypothetical protein
MVMLRKERPTTAGILAAGVVLTAAVAWAEVRQEVCGDWEYQYRTMGTPYSDRDPKDWNKQVRGLRLLENDRNAPTEEPYLLDRQAAFWPSDRDQCDVVARRTAALLKHLSAANPAGRPWQGFSDRLAKLAARRAETKPDREGADAVRKALYLDLCALRREIVLANPLLDFDSVLFNEISDSGEMLCRPTDTPQNANPMVYPGGGLYVTKGWKGAQPRVVDLVAKATPENGPYKGRSLSGGCFHSPGLSYDGKTVYFSWADPNATPDRGRNQGLGRYSHIFRIGIDGAGLRQLTFGPYNDFDCCELPDGRLVFMSTRREGYDRCICFRPACFLHSMKADGSDIICLSFFETHEWECSVDNDGMVVYSRWDYVDRHVHSSHAFWRCFPDGRDSRAPHGNYYFPIFDPRKPLPDYAGPVNLRDAGNRRSGPSWMGTPVTELSIRAIPGTQGKYVATAAGHHNPSHGALIVIDLNKPDDYRHGQISRITQNPYALDGDQPHTSCLWSSPWPLSEDFYLANYLDRLYVLDRFGNRELIYHMAKARELNATKNPGLNSANQGRAKNSQPPLERLDVWEFDGQSTRWRPVWPRPVQARPMPRIIPTQTFQSEDRRGAPGHKPATLSVMNVYNADVPLPKDKKIKWLRLVQILATSSGQYKGVSPGNQGATVSRLPLGIVPVEEDGSVYCEAPINRGLYFQLLNEDGLAVQSMRSLTYVHPGERMTCVGCHEPYDAAPKPPTQEPLAMRRGPSKIQPEFPEGVVPPDYQKQIVPIFEQVCVACHTKQGKGPATVADLSLGGLSEKKTDGSKGRSRPAWVQWGWTANSGRGFARTTPGLVGAMGSLLWPHVQKNPKAFTDEQRKRLAWWMDLSCPLQGGYGNYYTEPINGVRWPIHQDIDPANPLGIEHVGAPVRSAGEIAEDAAKASGAKKAALLETLARQGPHKHLDLYVAALSDPNEAVRRCAMRVVADVGDVAVLPAMAGAMARATSHDEAADWEKPLDSIRGRVADKRACVAAFVAALPKATAPGKCALLRMLGEVGGDEAIAAARRALGETKSGPENIALRAKAAASSELKPATAARFAIDGHIPNKGGGADDNAAWAANGKEALPTSFTLEWDQAVQIAEVVYHGRTAWSADECWKDCELYLDDATTPAAKVQFAAAYGPQSVRLAKPATARKLTLKFLSSHGGANPGASEVKVYSGLVPDLGALEVRAVAEAVLAQMQAKGSSVPAAAGIGPNRMREEAVRPAAGASRQLMLTTPQWGGSAKFSYEVYDLDGDFVRTHRVAAQGIGEIVGIAVFPETQRLYISGQKGLLCYDCPTHRLLWRVPVEGGQADWNDALTLSADGKLLYTFRHWSKGLTVYRAEDGARQRVILADDTGVWGKYAQVSHDGQDLHVLGKDVLIVDVQTEAVRARFTPAGRPAHFMLSPDGCRYVYATGARRSLAANDAKTGALVYEIATPSDKEPVEAQKAPLTGFALSPTGLAAWASDAANGVLHRFDLAAQPPRHTHRVAVDPPPGPKSTQLMFSVDGRFLITGAGAVVSPADGKPLGRLRDEDGNPREAANMVTLEIDAGTRRILRASQPCAPLWPGKAVRNAGTPRTRTSLAETTTVTRATP